jgi:hypothetical protein
MSGRAIYETYHVKIMTKMVTEIMMHVEAGGDHALREVAWTLLLS